MKKNNVFILIIIGLVAIVGVLLDFCSFISSPVVPLEIGIFHNNAKRSVILVIDDGGGVLKNFKGELKEGMTALDLLKEGAAELNLDLTVKSYDIGVFIETIGQKKNGDSGKYWMYYVNGELAPVAADKKDLKAGDRVEFKFEKSPF
jgi:hypothetical protein